MFISIKIDKASSAPLQDQIYIQIRDLIVSGFLKADSRLIATRFLAEQLGVSRTTVLLVYERLISEGYLETRPAVGTFVCSEPPETVAKIAKETPQAIARQGVLHPPADVPGYFPETASSTVDFSGECPDPSLFPLNYWKKLVRAALEDFPHSLVLPPPAGGVPALRAAVAEWLAVSRGMQIHADQVVIVSGRQQAFHLASQLFLHKKKGVVMEAPPDMPAYTTYRHCGADVYLASMNQDGQVKSISKNNDIAFLHVMPSRYNYIDGIISEKERDFLILTARENGLYILEDSYDGDFHYSGSAIPAIFSKDIYGLTLYIGSFTACLGAGLRLGYMVVPSEITEAVVAAKALFDKGNAWLEQAALAEFMTSGEYSSHLRRIRKIYISRRDALLACLRQQFGAVDIKGSLGGSHLHWILPLYFPKAEDIQALALTHGVSISCPNPEYCPHGLEHRILTFSYAQVNEWKIREGVKELGRAIDHLMAEPPSSSPHF